MPDGRILLAGRFTSYGGLPARGLVRLLPDGTVDNNFSAGGGAQWTSTMETAALVPAVEQIEKQNDGTFLLGGTFEKFNGTPAPGLVLIHGDGSVDSSLSPVPERKKFRRGVTSLDRQADGSFLLSGHMPSREKQSRHSFTLKALAACL